MPALICGLLSAGAIAATMSSSDSDLLGAGAIFTNDIYRAVLKPDASSKEVMRGTQITMVASGAIAAVIPGSAMVIYLERVSGGDLFAVHLSQPISPGLVVGLIFFAVSFLILPPKKKTTELASEDDGSTIWHQNGVSHMTE